MKERTMLFQGGKRKAFTLSYDDSDRNNLRLIEILNRYGLKTTLNLNGAGIGKEKRLTPDEVKAFDAQGHEIAVHGWTHADPRDLDGRALTHEITEDLTLFEGLLGHPVRGMAYAYGGFNETTVPTLQTCGITYSRTTISSHKFRLPKNPLLLEPTCHHDDPELFSLLDRFLGQVRQSGPILFYLWGHAFEYERNGNWDRLEKICQTVSGKDDIWYATNGEIIDYLWAYRSLRFTFDGTVVTNPTATPVWLADGWNALDPVCIGAGETVKLN